MYSRRMQRIRRVMHERRVHETQRRSHEAHREQMQAVVHTIVR